MRRKGSPMATKAPPLMWAGHPLYISKDGTFDSLDEDAVKRYDEAQARQQRETKEQAAALAALIKSEREVK